jgi:hypothetical protein
MLCIWPLEPTFRVEVGSNLTCKHWTKMYWLNMDKHSNSFVLRTNDEEKNDSLDTLKDFSHRAEKEFNYFI